MCNQLQRVLRWKCTTILLLLILSFGSVNLIQAQDVILASGGQSISIDSVGAGYVNLTGPTIRETAAGQLSSGGTIILELPTGYEWNTALTGAQITLTVTPTGAAITKLDVSFTSINASQVVFTVNAASEAKGNGQGPGRIEISGLQLRPTNFTIPNTATISNVGTTGPDVNYGNLSKKAGKITEVTVETAANGSGTSVPSQDLLAGSPITLYAIGRDQGGNFVENVQLAEETDWTLNVISGSILPSSLNPAINLRSATFSSQATGTSTITALVNDPPGETITENPSGVITVTPREASEFSIATQPASTAIAGVAYSTPPVINLLDQFGNLVTTDNTTQATIAIESGDGTLSGTLTQTATSGVISFSGLSSDIANSITLSISNNLLETVITNSITVDHNEANDLLFIQQPANTAQNGTINPPVKLQLLDDYGNYVDSTGVTVNIADQAYFKNNSTLSGLTDANGVATFANINLTNGAPTGLANLTASFSGISSTITVPSNDYFIIDGNDLAKFVIETTSETPIGTQQAGQSFNIRIRALDGGNDVFTGFSSTVNLTADSEIQVNGSTVPSITTDNFVNGVLETSLTLITSGLNSLYVENTDINRTGQSNEFEILPGVLDATTSTVTANPVEIVADQTSTSTITIQLKDEFGNNLTTGGETINLSTTAGSLASTTATDQSDGSYTGTLTSATTSGVTATVSASIDDSPNPDINITDDTTVDFVPGDVASFEITTPGTQEAGVPFTVTIEALDAQGNLVVGYNGSATISTNSIIDGSNTATFTGGTSSYDVQLNKSGNNIRLTATADDLFNITGTSGTFSVNASDVNPDSSSISVNPTVLQNQSSENATVTLILRDEFGNRVFTEERVGLNLTTYPTPGTPAADTTRIGFNASLGTYTWTLTADATVENIEITGKYGNPFTTVSIPDRVSIVVPNTWTAGAGGPAGNKTDWTNPDNWTSGVPTSDDFVIIPNIGDVPILDLNISVGSFEIQSGVALTLFGGNSISVTGNLLVNGSLDVEDNTQISIGGNFTGTGSFSGGTNTSVSINGNISVSSFLARTLDTEILLDGLSPQQISTGNFLAQYLDIQNDVTATSGNELIDVNVLNIGSGFTFELASGNIDTLDIQSDLTGSGNLVINDNAIVLRGNLNLENIDATSGSVIFGIRPGETDYSGLAQQQITSLSEMQNAIINNTFGVRTYQNIIIPGNLTLENGPLIISSGKSLIAPNITYNSGIIRMRRTISGSRGWRMLAAPLDTSYADFLDKTVTQGYPGATYATGSEPGDTLQPNVLWYDGSDTESDELDADNNPLEATDNDRWRTLLDADNTVTPGRGYFVYFFGNIATDPLYNTPLPLTLDIEGREHVNTAPFNFTDINYNEVSEGWNLVGNPFTASIDWDDMTRTNIDNVVYAWDPATNDYFYWNGIGGGSLDGTKLGNGIIKPFQAFWVKANAENPALSIDASSKTVEGTFLGKRERNPEVIGLQLSIGNKTKSTYITFSPDGKTGKDSRDAFRLLPFSTNTFLEFYSTLDDGTELAINNLARAFGTEMEIPLHIGGYEEGLPVDGTFTITLTNAADLPEGWQLVLIDKKNKKEVNLSKEISYTFNHIPATQNKIEPNMVHNFRIRNKPSTAKIISQNSTFTLKITPGEDASGLPDSFDLKRNYPNPFNPSTTLEFSTPLEGPVSLEIYDILGRKVSTLVDDNFQAGFHKVSWDASQFSSGVYFAIFRAGGKEFTQKLSLIK